MAFGPRERRDMIFTCEGRKRGSAAGSFQAGAPRCHGLQAFHLSDADQTAFG